MHNNLLYYPYIDIPQNNWTIKSLLYWDKVGIIVPPDFVENPNQYKNPTLDLIKTDLVEQVRPHEYIHKVRKFDKGFIELISQKNFNLEKKQQNFKNGKFSRIHIQKFGAELLDLLVSIKIAKKIDDYWYYVESKTADLIMIYLASVIGKVGKFLPSTDNLKKLDLSLNQNGRVIRTSMVRQNLLDDLIPYPLNPDLTKLRKFKDKYHDELKSFRILLEQSAFELSNYKVVKRGITQDLKVAEIQDKKEKILSELNKSQIGKITFGTIFGVTGAVIGYAQGDGILGTFSLVNAIHSAFEGYDNSNLLNMDYSYLALVDKNFK